MTRWGRLGVLTLLGLTACSSVGRELASDPLADNDASTPSESDTGAVDAGLEAPRVDAVAVLPHDSGVTSPMASDAAPGAPRVIETTCPDGVIYAAEVIPNRVDISDLTSKFDATKKLDWAIQVLARRYATGATILARANNDTGCFDIGVKDATTAKDVIAGLRTSVHECGHMVDLNQESFVFSPANELKCDFSIARGTAARSIILNDAYEASWPGDGFKDLYLVKYGDQDFTGLLTESLQYINTLATSYAFYDITTFDPVARDGVHAFQWYIGRYLRELRLNHASDYAKLTNDSCWRRVILTGWGRAYRYLVASKGLKDLGGEDDALLETLQTAPAILDEIQRIRVLEKCVAP